MEEIEELGSAGGAQDAEWLREIVGRLGEASVATNRYEVRGEIARGGMGVVLDVWDRDLRRRLAMKAALERDDIDPSTTASSLSDRDLARFLEEAQITGQLEHPGVVPVHDLGMDSEGRVFFTMPLVDGQEFSEIIDLVHARSEGWNLQRALRTVLRICEAVSYAHSKDVIHRDLKPSNVMVGRFGETYVMDWGLARVLGQPERRDIRVRRPNDGSSSPPVGEGTEPTVHTGRDDQRGRTPSSPLMTMDGAILGTPAYMAPEQAQGRIDELDARADVYSIGAMLYHLLAGRMPFAAELHQPTPEAVLLRRLAGAPKPLSEVAPEAPTELVSICETAMADDPILRYASARELGADIDAFLSTRPISVREASLAYQLRLAYRRNRPLILMAAATILALLVGGGFFAVAQTAVIQQRLRTSDVMSARALPAEEARLYPALPVRIGGMQTWLERVDDLVAREDRWRGYGESGDAELRAESQEVLAGIERLRELRGDVAARLELARALRDPESFDRAARWRDALEAIGRDGRYAELELAPIDVLVPLGADPVTGFQEFWNVLSGAEPGRDGRGRIVAREGDGIVLVLLPGGPFRMGTPENRVIANEIVRELDLEPFFVAKFEVSQDQWQRVMGENPSHYPAGTEIESSILLDGREERISTLNPVDSMSWFTAHEFAERLGLQLPTEPQWEFACRAGEYDDWHWGPEAESLEGVENIADASALNVASQVERFDDGFAFTAPIGTFPANAFGLHDMHGNVAEWCRDWFDLDWVGADARKVFRGGSYLMVAFYSRAAFRQYDRPNGLNAARGLRLSLDTDRLAD